MTRVALGFRAFDPHELLAHAVAERLGAWRERDLEVELRDISAVPDAELDPGVMQVSCGSALLSRLRGEPWRVVLATVDRPLFWLCARSGGPASVTDLAGSRIASFPAPSPPAVLLRAALRRRGLDPDADLSLEPTRDDAARLGLLASGDAAAALISSATPPSRLRRREAEPLLWLGEELRVPTTGLAVHEEALRSDRDTALAVASALGAGHAAIRGGSAVVVEALDSMLDLGSSSAARETLAALLPGFTRDALPDGDAASPTITAIAAELGLPAKVGDLYRPL